MQVDWLTVVAQIVNFLILVWLLQHFLYGPIVRAMDRREQRIADRLKEAANKKEEAEAEARKYRSKQQDLDDQRDRMLSDAREQASEQKSSLEKSAREEVDKRKQEWIEQLEDQQRAFLRDVRRLAAERFFRLARQALRDLADEELEDQIARVFQDKMAKLDGQERKKIEKGCLDDNKRIIVKSRFELSSATKGQLTRTIRETLCEEADVEYRESEDIGCGIELQAGSQDLTWSIDSYLDDLEEALAHEIQGATRGAERSAAE
jgi:F-type H+-transporting ATPase subunit b